MSDAAASAQPDDENSVPALWAAARWFMRWLISVCGRPCEIVAMNMLVRKERRPAAERGYQADAPHLPPATRAPACAEPFR